MKTSHQKRKDFYLDLKVTKFILLVSKDLIFINLKWFLVSSILQQILNSIVRAAFYTLVQINFEFNIYIFKQRIASKLDQILETYKLLKHNYLIIVVRIFKSRREEQL